MSCLGLFPPFKEQCDFRLSTDQWCQSPGHSHIETPPSATFLEDAVYLDRLSYTSEHLCTQFSAIKVTLDEAVGVSTDHDRIGLRQALNAGSFIRDFTQCQQLLTPCSTHLPYNDQPSMDTHTDGKLDTFPLLQTSIEVSHGSKNAQTSPYGSLGIIFVCHGITKIDQETIAQELGDLPIVSLDNVRTRRLIGTYHVSVHFGVEVPC